MDFLIIVHKERLQIMSASPAVIPQDGEKQLKGPSETCDSVARTELDRDLSRLGDEITAKVRKPYTITKQRERWTDEEHQKFLEALKLYGRAWRQIEEHVGTKTAVQIRSHAQKFFSKMEREGSPGSKAPVSEIEIPPPRPKRKPAHPYPRKSVTLSSKSANIKSRSLKVSRRKSSGGELSLDFDNAVDVMKTNKSPASNVLEMDDLHLRNCSSKNASCVNVCQKPRKRGTEEVICEAFPKEAQEMPKLSRSTCNQPEVTSSPIGILACQPDSLMLLNNTMPFGVCGSKMLTTFQQMAVPYHHPMHSLAALQSAAAALLNSATANPNQLGKLEDVPTMASFFAAHAHLTSSLMPWINLNPMALAAAAAAAATTPWPGLGLQPAPLHLPLRPSAIFNDKFNAESSSTVATAMADAAAASFVDASAWLPLHGNFSHSPNASEVRSLIKPNPVVHSSLIEGRQYKGNSSEGSKNGGNECQQISSKEHEDASTVDGMPETTAHVNHPNFMAGDYAIPSAHHPQKSFYHCEKETSMDQEKPGHNSSTDSSSNEKKGKKRNGLNGTWSNVLLLQSKNGLQNPAYLKLGKPSIKVHNGETDSSPSVYQGSNSPKSGISPKISEGYGEGYAYKGKYNNRLDTLTTTVHVTDSTIEEQSGSSVCKTKDCVAPHCITNTSTSETQVEVDVSMQHENGWSHIRHEDISGEVSITANQRQCISSCGSTENKKAKAHDSPVICSRIKDTETKESGPKHQTEDSGSEVSPCDKAGKVLVQACLTRWQGGEIMFTRTCTCRAEAKEMDTHQEEARSSLGMGLMNGSKQRLPFVQPQSVHGSKASSSGSSKYTGHGFVPYRGS